MVGREDAEGFKNARSCVDDLLEMRDSILARGVFRYAGPID